MTWIIVSGILAVFLFIGWKLTSRSAYESAAYTVMQSDGEIELRKYPDLMMATTQMKGRSGGDGSFGKLFKYISGSNDNQQKVAMTTPVFMEASSPEKEGQMGFVLPQEVVDSQIPSPTNRQVNLTKRSGGMFAVIRFANQMNDTRVRQKTDQLTEWIERQGLVIESHIEMASYDPPWTPGPLRRNEILLRVRQP